MAIGESIPTEFTLLPVLIFFARVVDVSIGTVRMICVTRGRKFAAVVLGFFEIIIWVFAVSSVFRHLDRWENILAFAGGFAAGNALGMWIEERLALGVQVVSFVSHGTAHAVAESLRFAGFKLTTLTGNGELGPVAICSIVIPRKHVRMVIGLARNIDPNVVVTVEDAREGTACPVTYAPGKIPIGTKHMTHLFRTWMTTSRGRRFIENAPGWQGPEGAKGL